MPRVRRWARSAAWPIVHAASTEFLTAMHSGGRSKDDIDAGGVLPGYTGTIVRDGFAWLRPPDRRPSRLVRCPICSGILAGSEGCSRAQLQACAQACKSCGDEEVGSVKPCRTSTLVNAATTCASSCLTPIGALRRLQKMPHIVRAFFADPDLRYITA
jgi:hypothetical protein